MRADHGSMNHPISRPPRIPLELVEPPPLPTLSAVARPSRGEILLVNPFYPKDPNGSFGKHVLTPSLALTSIAAATSREWRVRFWDESLLKAARLRHLRFRRKLARSPLIPSTRLAEDSQ